MRWVREQIYWAKVHADFVYPLGRAAFWVGWVAMLIVFFLVMQGCLTHKIIVEPCPAPAKKASAETVLPVYDETIQDGEIWDGGHQCPEGQVSAGDNCNCCTVMESELGGSWLACTTAYCIQGDGDLTWSEGWTVP